jgi:hypothetical protein
MVAAHIRAAMQAKYPKADFTTYFAFLQRCKSRGRQTQNHHIAPRAQFPKLKNDYACLIPLTRPQHIKAHHLLGKIDAAMDYPCEKFIFSSGTPKQLAATLAAMARPEWRARYRAAMARPEGRARWRAAMARPEVKAQWRATMARPEVKARQREAARAAWVQPEVKARRRAAMRAVHTTKGKKLYVSRTRQAVQLYRAGHYLTDIAVAVFRCKRGTHCNRTRNLLIKAGVW